MIVKHVILILNKEIQKMNSREKNLHGIFLNQVYSASPDQSENGKLQQQKLKFSKEPIAGMKNKFLI